MSRSPSWEEVLGLAEDQWGLITTQQVESAGVAWTTLDRQSRGRSLERIARGVYRVRGAAEPDHLELRAAWLQLSPATPAWERTTEQGVVSHRSAAALYGIGRLPADKHEFTLPVRKQTRRRDVRLHRGEVSRLTITLRGLPVTRPARIAADLLGQREDPGAVGEVIADALRPVYDYPGTVATEIAPHAASLGLRKGDGIGLLRWLLDLTGDPERNTWIEEAISSSQRTADSEPSHASA